jgi:hypothetical protein
MPTELAIACSLSARDLQRRLADMADVGTTLLDARHEGARARLRFADGARDRIDAIAAAEAECCAFLDMNVTEEAGAVVLSIAAPEGAELVLEELVGAMTSAR